MSDFNNKETLQKIFGDFKTWTSNLIALGEFGRSNLPTVDSLIEELDKKYIVLDRVNYSIKTVDGDGLVDFGRAIQAAKEGKRVTRAGWNGQGIFAYIVPANSYPAQTETAKRWLGNMVPYRAYWALKTAQGDVATWHPSGSDSLAEDWIILED